MEKIEYLDLLKIYLKSYKLSDEEINDIIAEYNRKFDYYTTAGLGEDDVVAELGSAKEVASQYAPTILQHTDIKDVNVNKVEQKDVVKEKQKYPDYVQPEKTKKTESKSVIRKILRFIVVGTVMFFLTTLIIMPMLAFGALLIGTTFGSFVCMFAPVLYVAQSIFGWMGVYPFELMIMFIIAGCSMIGFGISYVVTKFYFKIIWKYFKFVVNAVRGNKNA